MKRTKETLNKATLTIPIVQGILRKYFVSTINFVIPNQFGMDFLIISYFKRHGTEITIKLIAEDLTSMEFEKNPKIKDHWLVVPLKFEQQALQAIPKYMGLLTVYYYIDEDWRIRVSKLPEPTKTPYVWSDAEIFQLFRKTLSYLHKNNKI